MTASSSIKNLIYSPRALNVVFAVAFIGLYYSRALTSIFDVSIFALGLFAMIWRADWKKRLWNRHTIPFILIFVIYVLSMLMSTDKSEGLHRLKTNNYYVLIPLGISMLQPFSKKLIQEIIATFVFISTCSALIVLLDYAFNFSQYSEAYKVGKTIETPILHIRYAYFMCLATLMGFALMLEGKLLQPIVKKLIAICTIILFIFIHILAVRTGIVSCYIGLFVFLIVRSKDFIRPLYSIATGLALVVVLVLAVKYVPSLKNKWQYTRYDIARYFNDDQTYLLSDNLRFISIKNGLILFDENPLFGTGIGDLDKECQRLYAKSHPDVPIELQSPPVTQYFYTLTAFGLIGAIAFFGLLLYPFRYAEHRRDIKLLLIYGATFGSFIGDYSIELQLGKVAFVTLASLALWYATPLEKIK